MLCRILDGGDCNGTPAWRPPRVGADESAVATKRAPEPAPGASTEPPAEALRAEWERQVREAREAGRREGESTGRQAAAAELQPVREAMAHSIEELAGLRARLLRNAERDAVLLALSIARRVLRREVAVDPQAVAGLVRVALERLAGQEVCRVRIHPGQEKAVRAALQQLGCAAELVADAALHPGGMVMETHRGSLDVSVETQLEEIERGLADRFEQAS